VSVVLGELVTREVQRHRSRRLREGEIEDCELVDAIDRARVQQADPGRDRCALGAAAVRTGLRRLMEPVAGSVVGSSVLVLPGGLLTLGTWRRVTA